MRQFSRIFIHCVTKVTHVHMNAVSVWCLLGGFLSFVSLSSFVCNSTEICMDFLLQSFEDLESFSRFCVKKKRSTPTKPNQNQSSEKRKSLIVTFNHFPRIIGNAAPRSPPRSSVGKQNYRRFSFFSPQDGLKG